MNAMRLIPAIDLRDGAVVRLLKGDFGRETRYAGDPAEIAARYRALGADWLHVVDLDGARSGQPVNLDTIRGIARASGLRIQLGGGIRGRESLLPALDVAERVVIGSLGVTEPERVKRWMDEFGADRFTLGFDVRLDGERRAWLTTHGWTRSSDWTLDAAIDAYLAAGLRHVLCTDVDRDGAMTGPNLDLYRDCASRWPEVAFQASGGVRGADDLAALAGTGVSAAISGRALLEGKLDEEEIRAFLPNA